jgi:hypothetical protein
MKPARGHRHASTDARATLLAVREEQARETKEFRGLDRVLKSSAKPAKRQETGRVRKPKP